MMMVQSDEQRATIEALRHNLAELPISTLAYIGDAVFELRIRLSLFCCHRTKSGFLHQSSVGYVKADAQAALLQAITPLLTEAEMVIVRRARNHQPHSKPKHADVLAYRHATSFEALIGYLYLDGQKERLNELLKQAMPELPAIKL